MREKCFIDTTVVLKVILEGRADLLEKLSGYILHTSVNVLEEAEYPLYKNSFFIMLSSITNVVWIFLDDCS